MSVEENVKAATAFEDASNARDWDRLGRTIADSVIAYDPAELEPLRGRDTVLGMLQRSVEFFPTARIEGVHRFGRDDHVCVENVRRVPGRTQTRATAFGPATPFGVAGGELAELRFYYDALGMMTQIGMSLSGGEGP